MGFPGDSDGKASACNADWAQYLSQKDALEKGMQPVQYSCLENPMDRGPWWATVPGAAKGQTRLVN